MSHRTSPLTTLCCTSPSPFNCPASGPPEGTLAAAAPSAFGEPHSLLKHLAVVCAELVHPKLLSSWMGQPSSCWYVQHSWQVWGLTPLDPPEGTAQVGVHGEHSLLLRSLWLKTVGLSQCPGPCSTQWWLWRWPWYSRSSFNAVQTVVVKGWLCLSLWHRKQLRGLQQTSVHTVHSTVIRTDAWLPSQTLGEGQSWSRKKTSPRDPGQPLSPPDVGLSNIILQFVCL